MERLSKLPEASGGQRAECGEDQQDMKRMQNKGADNENARQENIQRVSIEDGK